jgi:hypothetical protein
MAGDRACGASAISFYIDTSHGVRCMMSPVLKLAIAAALGCLFSSAPIVAQILPPAKKAEHFEITREPTLEIAVDDLAIIRWTTTNPGGDDEHFGIVHYGTDPQQLSQTAKSHIRLNRGHPEAVFRVRVEGLKPRTTYYYAVASSASDGQSDGLEITLYQFTTPAPGERIVAYPREPAPRPSPH